MSSREVSNSSLMRLGVNGIFNGAENEEKARIAKLNWTRNIFIKLITSYFKDKKDNPIVATQSDGDNLGFTAKIRLNNKESPVLHKVHIKVDSSNPFNRAIFACWQLDQKKK